MKLGRVQGKKKYIKDCILLDFFYWTALFEKGTQQSTLSLTCWDCPPHIHHHLAKPTGPSKKPVLDELEYVQQLMRQDPGESKLNHLKRDRSWLKDYPWCSFPPGKCFAGFEQVTGYCIQLLDSSNSPKLELML